MWMNLRYSEFFLHIMQFASLGKAYSDIFDEKIAAFSAENLT